MKTEPAPRAPLTLRAGSAGYAALFSGEDGPEPAAAPPPGGLWRATAGLVADSARTLFGAPPRGQTAQPFARSAT